MKIAQIAESGVIDYSNFRSSLKRLEEQHDNHQTLAVTAHPLLADARDLMESDHFGGISGERDLDGDERVVYECRR